MFQLNGHIWLYLYAYLHPKSNGISIIGVVSFQETLGHTLANDSARKCLIKCDEYPGKSSNRPMRWPLFRPIGLEIA